MRKLFGCLFALALIVTLVPTAMAEGDPTLEALKTAYAEPEMQYWPEIRWWLAEGSHTDETLRASVQEIYDAGFRSVEVLTLTEASLDKAIYGWGSEEWYHDSQVIFEAANALGMGVCFTSGPNWQPAVPNITPDMEGAAKELGFAWKLLQPGEALGSLEMTAANEVITEQPLVALLAAKLDGEYAYDDGATTYLQAGSIVDLTDGAVQDGNTISADYIAPEDGQAIVFAFWMEGTAQSASSSSEPTYVVNHFTCEGAQAMIEFWDEYMFTDDMQALIDANGSVDYFQDSLEIHTNRGSYAYWCSDMLDEFAARRGYDLTEYLPALIRENQDWGMPLNAPIFDVRGMEAMYEKARTDFAITLSDLYEDEYLTPIREWLHGHHVNLRTQVSYGQILEQSMSVRAVDIPEMETLFFNDNVDGYRLQSGVAHLYGKNIISNEMGPILMRAYDAPLQEFLNKINTGLVSGTNRMIFHGYSAITGPDDTTSWPGYDGIGYMWSERWGSRMPFWQDIDRLTAYIARVQQATRQGKPRVDLGIINESIWTQNFVGGVTGIENTPWAEDNSLAAAGYSYEYFSPYVMSDGETFVYADGVIAPDGPAYQALVAWQAAIPADSAAVLLEMAQAGLPVVIVDGALTESSGNDGKDDEVATALEALKALENVRVVEGKSAVSGALKDLGVLPRVSYETPADIESLLRQDGDTYYCFMYNETTEDQATTIQFDGVADVYEIDPWTGDVEPVAVYDQQEGRTSLALKIAAEDSRLLVFQLAQSDRLHAVSADAQMRYNGDALELIANQSGSYTVTLSDGTDLTVEAEVADAIPLESWTLSVDSWLGGEKHEITEERDGHTTTEYYYDTDHETINVALDALAGWDEIEAVGKAVSGIGTYATTFTLPDIWAEGDGALLKLAFIGSANVRVNGEDAGPVDLTNPVIDISTFLQAGENTLEIQVSSPLGNAMLAIGKSHEGPMMGLNFVGNTYHGGQAEITYKSYGLTKAEILPYTVVNVE